MSRSHRAHRSQPTEGLAEAPTENPELKRPPRPSAPRSGEASAELGEAQMCSIEQILARFLAEPRIRRLYERLTRRVS